MQEWVVRAMQRWPNVPALFGWLCLDRRGRWLIRGEPITRPQIIDLINANYGHDEFGRWFFQNGPQRGYMQLDYAPFALYANSADELHTHTHQPIRDPARAFLDENGALIILSEHGPGALIDDQLAWALERMSSNEQPITEEDLSTALALDSGALTAISLQIGSRRLPIERLDADAAPKHLHFVRDPQPRDNERVATRAPD